MLEAALEYADRGWPVVRLAAGTNVPLAGSHGHRDATTDAEQIRDWWSEVPKASIGISPGPAGLIIVDVDPRNCGEESFLDLCERHRRDWTETCTVLSPHGGQHYYFSAPDGAEIHGPNAVWPGIDVKAYGGYAAVPPSVRKEGSYEWEVGCDPASRLLLPAPDWLLRELGEAQEGRGGRSRAERVGAVIPMGKRNDVLMSIAGSMRQRGLGRNEILPALEATNRLRCESPLNSREVRALAESAASYAVTPEAVRRVVERKGTDLGNAERLVERFGDQLRYTPSIGWLV